MVTLMFHPIYYFGWVIQPTIEGFETYPRVDMSKNKSRFFATIEEVVDFIHSVIES